MYKFRNTGWLGLCVCFPVHKLTSLPFGCLVPLLPSFTIGHFIITQVGNIKVNLPVRHPTYIEHCLVISEL